MTRFCFTFLYLVIYCFDWWNKHAARERSKNICRRNSIRMISAKGILLFNELDEIKKLHFLLSWHLKGNRNFIFGKKSSQWKSNFDCFPRRPVGSMNNETKICVSNSKRLAFYYSWRFNAVTVENKQGKFSDENSHFPKRPENFLLRFLFTIKECFIEFFVDTTRRKAIKLRGVRLNPGSDGLNNSAPPTMPHNRYPSVYGGR